MHVFDSYLLILYKSIVSLSIQEDLQASFLAKSNTKFSVILI